MYVSAFRKMISGNISPENYTPKPTTKHINIDVLFGTNCLSIKHMRPHVWWDHSSFTLTHWSVTSHLFYTIKTIQTHFCSVKIWLKSAITMRFIYLFSVIIGFWLLVVSLIVVYSCLLLGYVYGVLHIKWCFMLFFL